MPKLTARWAREEALQDPKAVLDDLVRYAVINRDAQGNLSVEIDAWPAGLGQFGKQQSGSKLAEPLSAAGPRTGGGTQGPAPGRQSAEYPDSSGAAGNGGKGGTAVTAVNSVRDFRSSSTAVNGRSMAVTGAVPRTWQLIAQWLRMNTQNILASGSSDRAKRKDIAVRTILKRGMPILPNPGDRARTWICAAALYAERNPREVKHAITYVVSAVETAARGGSPAPDDYFREVESGWSKDAELSEQAQTVVEGLCVEESL